MGRIRITQYVLAGLILLFLFMLNDKNAFSDQWYNCSNIRVGDPDGIAFYVEGTEIPPHQTQVTTFRFWVRHAGGCTEQVKIHLPREGGFRNDPWSEREGFPPRGHARFLGFKERIGDEPSEELTVFLGGGNFDFYFDVETGEDADGCDFNAFSIEIIICDIGEKCFTCCDGLIDPPCESPTPHRKGGEFRAYEVPPLTGTGRIYGRITDSSGRGLHGRIHIRKLGECVVGAPDNPNGYDAQMDTDRGLPGNRGNYNAENLPFGNYHIVATVDGVRQERDVTINSATPREVNFVF